MDDRQWVGDIRQRLDEVVYQLESGETAPMPPLDGEPVDMRQWKSDQGPGQLTGPTVRAAGRVMLYRDKGKLLFIDIEDWTGRIQLFVGKKQVGEDNFEMARKVDAGDIIAVDGWLGVTNTGELTIFAESLHFHCKSLLPPPDKHSGLVDPELRQRQRYVDLAYNTGVRGPLPDSNQNRPVGSRDVGRRRICRD